LFAECVGFYYGLEKNRKVELRSKETILCFFFQRTPLYDFSLIHAKNQHIRQKNIIKWTWPLNDFSLIHDKNQHIRPKNNH
jgi:hypothetical protein